MGAEVRSLPDCALGAVATAVEVQPTGVGPMVRARIEIQPDHWLAGYIFLLGVSGSQLDIGDVVTHASRLTPTIDPSGTMVLFGFTLNDLPGASADRPVVEIELTGAFLQLRQLTCRPAPAPPPVMSDSSESMLAGYIPDDLKEMTSGMIIFDASVSDLLLVGLAAILTLVMLLRHCRDLRACCGGHSSTRVEGFELPTSEYDVGMRAHTGTPRSSRDNRRSKNNRYQRHDDEEGATPVD
jgi:hypothetical protein